MITTINLKDLIKYLVGLIVVILITVYSTRFFSNIDENKKILGFNFNPADLIAPNISIANYNEEEKSQESKTEYTSRDGFVRILDMELPYIESSSNNDNKEEVKDKEDEEEEEEERKTVQIKETYTNTYGSVKIKNLTNIKLTESILKPLQ